MRQGSMSWQRVVGTVCMMSHAHRPVVAVVARARVGAGASRKLRQMWAEPLLGDVLYVAWWCALVWLRWPEAARVGD